MVGSTKGIMTSLAEISKLLVGVKFKHCSTDRSQGYDCFTNIVMYLNMLGADISFETIFKGVSFDYRKEYALNPHKTMDLAHEYIASITTEIKKGFERAGDILVLRTKRKENTPLHLGIDAGNGSAIVAIRDRDIKVLTKKIFIIERAYRWVQKY